MLIFTEVGKPENPKKNPRSKGEGQQQTQLTYDSESGNRIEHWATVVRGERSHRYATHASRVLCFACIMNPIMNLICIMNLKMSIWFPWPNNKNRLIPTYERLIAKIHFFDSVRI
jgi:hypothetical protein